MQLAVERAERRPDRIRAPLERAAVPAKVAGRIAFNTRECPRQVWENLFIDLTFRNPEYVRRARMNQYLGATEEFIHAFEGYEDGTVEIPRGAVDLLREHLGNAGYRVVFEDKRLTLPPIDLRADITLRPYQEEAVRRMVSGVQGTVVLPCGGGKTILLLGALARIKQPALIIVHTRDLLEQWREVIRSVLHVEPGIVTEGKVAPGPITVATIQTLARQPDLSSLARLFGCVVVDEAHYIPSAVFRHIVPQFPARYRFGLTATPKREDGLTALLELTMGRRLFGLSQADLINAGFLQKPDIQPVHTGFTFDYRGPKDYHRCIAALVADEERNDLISDLAIREAVDGHTVLVLSNRVAHCEALCDLINSRGVRAKTLVGQVKKSERRRILAEFKSGELSVVVASTLADEGLDIARLDRIILAFPGKAQGRTIQRLGRLMRIHPEKEDAVLYDLVDSQVPPLLRQFRRRLKLYSQLEGDVR